MNGGPGAGVKRTQPASFWQSATTRAQVSAQVSARLSWCLSSSKVSSGWPKEKKPLKFPLVQIGAACPIDTSVMSVLLHHQRRYGQPYLKSKHVCPLLSYKAARFESVPILLIQIIMLSYPLGKTLSSTLSGLSIQLTTHQNAVTPIWQF